MECNRVLLLESYFDFVYSKEISAAMRAVFVRMCNGCTDGCLSQREHSCLTLSDEEQLGVIFRRNRECCE